jgi:hypothetical protein
MMSDKSRAHAAQKLTGDPYNRCLQWMRNNKEKARLRVQAMKGSGKTGNEEAALYYQEQQERMITE